MGGCTCDVLGDIFSVGVLVNWEIGFGYILG